jgi:hypothetical protein
MFDKGMPDSWLILVAPEALSNYHHLGLCQDPDAPGKFVYRLNVVHSELVGEVWLSRSTAGRLRRWEFDTSTASQVWEAPVMTVASIQMGSDRHTMPMLTECSSFKDVIARLSLLVEHGEARVVISSRGSFKALASQPGSNGFCATDGTIVAAHASDVLLLGQCEQALSYGDGCGPMMGGESMMKEEDASARSGLCREWSEFEPKLWPSALF